MECVGKLHDESCLGQRKTGRQAPVFVPSLVVLAPYRCRARTASLDIRWRWHKPSVPLYSVAFKHSWEYF